MQLFHFKDLDELCVNILIKIKEIQFYFSSEILYSKHKYLKLHVWTSNFLKRQIYLFDNELPVKSLSRIYDIIFYLIFRSS